MNISEYRKSDIEEIRQLFNKVFADSEGKDEGLSVSKLAYDLLTETDPQDLYGFTAKENDHLVGSIIFSRMRFERDVSAFILSPVAIHTDHQGKGLGQKLISFGIKHLKENGVELLLTYGNPAYYSKVGFSPINEEIVRAPVELSLPFGWLGQSLVSEDIQPIKGRSRCVSALNDPGYW